ncbi:MAG: DUF1802 family protein [Aphanothece sp. CMT-3BRIN-NPC111]|jgi:hypothetical protein|nr:DUF1802 family protein [Aphanothece sp. CMT-3BRIN-NPC111]
MSNLVPIYTALCLPAPDVEALIQGQMIATTPRVTIEQGRQFALYPSDRSINALPLEECYRASFLPIAQTAIINENTETVKTKAWARCEFCQIWDKTEPLEALSRLTVWRREALQEILLPRPHIFIAYLRVYLIPEPIEILVSPENQNQLGKFVGLQHSLTVSESSPVLSDRTFAQRRHQLEHRLPPPHPELEELQGTIAQLAITNPAAKKLDGELKIFLGWTESSPVTQPNPDLAWIHKIAEVGNSSDGQAFEKLVRKSFIKLGFTNSNRNSKASLDPNATGGAGGIDIYCEAPYPVVGECKASKNESVPNSVTAQLIHLGVTHLGQVQFDHSIKLIFAAGPLTEPARKAAIENKMNVIRPETLQKLVELKAKHEGSINLLELKQCFQQEPFGVVDDKVNSYIDKVQQGIKLRSHLVQVLKKYQEEKKLEAVGVERLCGVYDASNPPKSLSDRELHEILIELCSPLAGYLGRIKADEWRRDRFYFLRDLPIEQNPPPLPHISS